MTNERVDFHKYRGQWGGKIDTGEEMWWSEPNYRLFSGSPLARLRFICDTRQHFLIKYLNHIIKNRRDPLTTPVILDFGCGTGGLTLSMSKVIAQPINGYDVFPTLIQIANAQAKNIGSHSSFKCLIDGRFDLPDQSVDAILSADVLGHVPDIPKTLAEWFRVLKPGGGVSLFTEATYSDGDRSLQARLARQGLDLCAAVPEHISLFPREKLEEMFRAAGFEIIDRRSANVLHWLFFPKDYVLLFTKFGHRGPLSVISRIWNLISKLIPFYPVPHEFLRLILTRILGRNAYGTGYFYELRRPN